MTHLHVDGDLCTRCGICSIVCTPGIIEPPGEKTPPFLSEGNAGMCMRCGHCEAFCPAGALQLEDGPSAGVQAGGGATGIPADDLSRYLRMRRSIRHFTADPVPRATIESILNIARYAPSGGNGQPVEWIVVYDPEKVRRIAGLTIGFLKTLAGSAHPMSGYIPRLVSDWEEGRDPICRGAPHLLVAHIPDAASSAPVDAIIALSWFDIAAPVFGVGTCWAGFVAMAAAVSAPLQEEIGLPAGRIPAYAMMMGFPRYAIHGIPARKPLKVTWR